MAIVSEPRTCFIDVGYGRRNVLEWGRPDGPALLLQHGMRDHARSWEWVAAAFGDRYRIIAPDLRGHGDSDRSIDGAYALSNYVFDLAAIVETLGVERFDLVGHSLGGHIALRYAATFPERIGALCVIEGIELPIVRDQQRTPTSFPARLRRWISDERNRLDRLPRYYASVDDARQRMAEQNPGLDPETVSHLTHHALTGAGDRGWRWKFDNAAQFRAPDDAHAVDLDEVLAGISCPTLLAYGEKSWIPVPAERRLRRIRDHRIVMFPNASHWLHHEARDHFLRELADFLAAPASYQTRKREIHA